LLVLLTLYKVEPEPKDTLAEQSPGSALTEMGLGQVMVGAVLSTLLTVKVQGALVLPDASVAVKVTVKDPAVETVVPAAGVWVQVREAAAVQPSLAVAKPL
jgi:hypothetical protein